MDPSPCLDALLLADPVALFGASSSEATAIRFVEGLRWPGRVDPDAGAPCPRCASDQTAVIGTTRGTRAKRRLWRCKECSKNWTARTGTRLEGGQVPLHAVLLALWLVTEGNDTVLSLDAALAERRALLTPAARLKLAGETLEAVRHQRPEETLHSSASSPRPRARWVAAAGIALALVISGWGVTQAASGPRELRAEWTSAGGRHRVLRTPRREGESRDGWRARHTENVERLQALADFRPVGS